jgi:amino acid transporter
MDERDAIELIRDLPAAQRAANPLMATLEQALGARWILPALVVVGVSVFACGLASMAATSRLLFALARDRMLPGSRWLAFVAEVHRTPRNAIIFVWAISSGVVLGLPSLDIITQVSAVAGYLGYAGIVIAALRAPAGARTEGSSWAARAPGSVRWRWRRCSGWWRRSASRRRPWRASNPSTCPRSPPAWRSPWGSRSISV